MQRGVHFGADRRRVRGGCGLLLLIGGLFAAAAPPADPPDREAALWQRVAQRAAALPAASGPDAPAGAALAQREALLAELRRYLRAYPGGRWRAAEVELELRCLFELGVLRGGQFAPLRAAVRAYLRGPAHDPARAPAARWAALLEHMQSGPDGPAGEDWPAPAAARACTTQPGTGAAGLLWCAGAIEAALERGDVRAAEDILAAAEACFAPHPLLDELRAAVDRQRAAGRPFWLRFADSSGRVLDTRDWLGRPVLILVWHSGDPAAAQMWQIVDQTAAQWPELAVVGVDIALPGRPEDAGPAAAARWPQYRDPLGPANPFVRQWGVRRVPFAFAIGADGRLRAAGPDLEAVLARLRAD